VEDLSFDLVAASLRADTSDVEAFVEALAVKLEGAVPGRVRVKRRSRGLMGAKRVSRIVLTLGDERYELELESGQVICTARTLVRGVSIRSEQLTLSEWIDRLANSLVLEAQASAEGRAALGQLIA
jgi:hypothetical protein